MNITPRSSKILQKSENLASKHKQPPNEIYLLWALLTTPEGLAHKKLLESGVSLEALTKAAGQSAPQLDSPLPTNQLMQHIAGIAASTGNDFIGSEHILMGLLDCPNVVNLFESCDQNIEAVREQFMSAAGHEQEGAVIPTNGGNTKSPALEVFGRNLTEEAQSGKLDPVVGRSEQITRMMQILCRRTKNNPILIGEAGVGKTAVVEGLAQAIASGEVPEILAKRKIFLLDMAKMVAGTKYRGQFEERLKVVLKECEKDPEVIIFLDEIHTIVGAGSAGGSMDASNMLKPALSRGELQCIGATTEQEYRKYIEKDAALERRFQTVSVPPASVSETVEILKGLRAKLEEHHKLQIPDEAITNAAQLADRYISQRHLPDKAIDVIDEACSRVRMRLQQESKLRQEAIADLQVKKNNAVEQKNFRLADDLAQKQAELQEEPPPPRVTDQDIHTTLTKMTGIPSGQLSQDDTSRILGLERWLNERLVGQEPAVTTICRTIRRSKADLQDPQRPLGAFLLLGPTGTGKTYLTKLLGEQMYGSAESVIQIDMSEYMEKHAVSRLIGAAPGYIGYDEGGQLTEAVRKKPHSIVLFDEVEKAHPDALNLLLQILEEGKLTDSSGRKVNFRNCLIFLTSNIGSSAFSKAGSGSIGFSPANSSAKVESVALEEAKRSFRPELLNRLSEIVVFSPLPKSEISRITDLEISKVAARLKEKNIHLSVTEQAHAFLVDRAFSTEFGARHVRRTVEKYLEECLIEPLLQRTGTQEAQWNVDLSGQSLAVRVQSSAPSPHEQPNPPRV
jgi:ATP-dependent Clp protease ATP-binding subunit ClpC